MPIPTGNEVKWWTSSEAREYARCPQRWAYLYLHRRRGVGVGQALTRGIAFHAAVATQMHRLKDGLAADPDALRADILTSLGDVEAGTLRDAKAIANYTATWLTEATLPWDKVVDVEVPLERPKEVEPHIQIPPLRGILDAVVTRGDKTWVLDWKTVGASVPVATYLAQFRRGPQATGYTYLAQGAYPNVAGFILILVRCLAAKTKTGDVRTWRDAIEVVDLSISPDVQSLGLATLNRTWMAMKNARKGHLHGRPFEQRGLLTGACSGDHGNSLCPFLDVCEGRLDILDDLYFTDHDPNARYQPDGGEI